MNMCFRMIKILFASSYPTCSYANVDADKNNSKFKVLQQWIIIFMF